MNTTSSNPSVGVCLWIDSLTPAISIITYITYTIIPIPSFISGMIGHLIALIAFVQQRKTDTGYAYQIFVTAVKIFSIFWISIWVLCFIHLADQDWSGQKGEGGWVWFKSSYALMWFTGKVTTVLQSCASTLSILAATAMAAARVFGLWKPIVFKGINKKRHQMIAYISCSVIALLISFDTWARWTVGDGTNGVYKMVPTTFGSTVFGTALSQIRSGFRFLVEFALIFCSVFMIRLYNTRAKKVQKLTNGNAKEENIKQTQRTLYTLAIFHSVSTAIPVSLLATYIAGPYVSGNFLKCGGQIFAVLADMFFMLVNASDISVLYFTNRQFRVMVKKLINKSTVSAIGNGQGGL